MLFKLALRKLAIFYPNGSQQYLSKEIMIES